MYDSKIFTDIQGIFSWMEECKRLSEIEQKENPKKKIFERFKEEEYDDDNANFPKKTIRDFLAMINVQTTEDEVEALYEMISVADKKKPKPFGTSSRSDRKEVKPEDLSRLFVKDEKEAIKERDQALECFKALAGDPNSEDIDLEKLGTMMRTYDKKYAESLEDLLGEIESSQYTDGKNFDFKRFVEDIYKPNATGK